MSLDLDLDDPLEELDDDLELPDELELELLELLPLLRPLLSLEAGLRPLDLDLDLLLPPDFLLSGEESEDELEEDDLPRRLSLSLSLSLSLPPGILRFYLCKQE